MSENTQTVTVSTDSGDKNYQLSYDGEVIFKDYNATVDRITGGRITGRVQGHGSQDKYIIRGRVTVGDTGGATVKVNGQQVSNGFTAEPSQSQNPEPQTMTNDGPTTPTQPTTTTSTSTTTSGQSGMSGLSLDDPLVMGGAAVVLLALGWVATQ